MIRNILKIIQYTAMSNFVHDAHETKWHLVCFYPFTLTNDYGLIGAAQQAEGMRSACKGLGQEQSVSERRHSGCKSKKDLARLKNR